MPPDADAQRMLSAKAGDMNALDELIRKHRAAVVRFLHGMIRNYAVSEELAQEVFLRVHRHREDYEVTAKFTTWLYRIAGRLALNWLRDHGHERFHEGLEASHPGTPPRQYPDPRARIDEWLLRQRRFGEVRRAVGELPERQRAAVMLHKFEEIGCEEIAASMGCSHQAVRSLLCRAYSTLRTRLAEFEAG